jgi:hypothetical protein
MSRASLLILLWLTILKDERDRGVTETLPGHEGLVTCVRFIRDDIFASADDKGALRYWRKIGQQACMPSANLVNVSNKCGQHFAVEIYHGYSRPF